MASIEDQLTQLTNDRDDLVSNLTTKGISGLTGDETFTELVPEVLNIQSGADLSEYFTSTIGRGDYTGSGVNRMIKKLPSNITVNGVSLSYAFAGTNNLTTYPNLDTSSVTNMAYMFYFNTAITTAPQYNTSSVTNMSNMFDSCTNLTTVPQYNAGSATIMSGMFSNCAKLTDDSLNNILAMCISATSFNGTKTLAMLGFNSGMYTAAKIQSLSNYTAFTNAGWAIGY